MGIIEDARKERERANIISKLVELINKYNTFAIVIRNKLALAEDASITEDHIISYADEIYPEAEYSELTTQMLRLKRLHQEIESDVQLQNRLTTLKYWSKHLSADDVMAMLSRANGMLEVNGELDGRVKIKNTDMFVTLLESWVNDNPSFLNKLYDECESDIKESSADETKKVLGTKKHTLGLEEAFAQTWNVIKEDMDSIRQKQHDKIYFENNETMPGRKLEEREINVCKDTGLIEIFPLIENIVNDSIRDKYNRAMRKAILTEQKNSNPTEFKNKLIYILAQAGIELQKQGSTNSAKSIFEKLEMDTNVLNASSGKLDKLLNTTKQTRKELAKNGKFLPNNYLKKIDSLFKGFYERFNSGKDSQGNPKFKVSDMFLSNDKFSEKALAELNTEENVRVMQKHINELNEHPDAIEARRKFVNRMTKLTEDLQLLTLSESAEQMLEKSNLKRPPIEGVSNIMFNRFKNDSTKLINKINSSGEHSYVLKNETNEKDRIDEYKELRNKAIAMNKDIKSKRFRGDDVILSNFKDSLKNGGLKNRMGWTGHESIDGSQLVEARAAYNKLQAAYEQWKISSKDSPAAVDPLINKEYASNEPQPENTAGRRNSI